MSPLQFIRGKGIPVTMARRHLPERDRSPHRLALSTQQTREEKQRKVRPLKPSEKQKGENYSKKIV